MNHKPPAAPTTFAQAFAHTSLDAFHLALEALVRGEAIARKLPRGYGPLRDQLSRALQSAYLQTCEGAARSGADRRARLGSARRAPRRAKRRRRSSQSRSCRSASVRKSNPSSSFSAGCAPRSWGSREGQAEQAAWPRRHRASRPRPLGGSVRAGFRLWGGRRWRRDGDAISLARQGADIPFIGDGTVLARRRLCRSVSCTVPLSSAATGPECSSCATR